MKCVLFVVFALFFVGSVLSYTECRTYTCVSVGGNCTMESTDSSISYPVCQKGSFCNNSICTPQVALGGACAVPIPGVDLECVGGDQGKSMCYQNTCQAITNKLSVGGNCSSPVTQCGQAYYCDAQTQLCTEYPAKGENCTADCAAGLACNLGTCIAKYSVAEGQACGNNFQDSDMCAAGLFCKLNATNPPGVCAAGFPSSNAACNATVACSNADEYCVCNKCTAPITATPSQAEDLVKLEQCIANSNCNPNNPGSCCKEYQCAAHKFSLSFYENSQFQKVATPCGYNEFNFCNSLMGRLTTAEKIAIAIGVIAGIVIIAGIIICCVRRRKHHYHQLH